MPSWLDTIPPRVEILPANVYHSSVFMITLSANKRAHFWVGINSKEHLAEYATPISITRDTALTVYYYGEDDFGNKSGLDSMHYVLDTRQPQLRVIPEPGNYQKGVVVYFAADEPCRFELLKDPSAARGKAVPESLAVSTVFEGYVAAIDSAGNRSVSGLLRYMVDTSTVRVTLTPEGGLFKMQPKVTFEARKGVKIFYSFDPLATPDLFAEFSGNVRVPHGISMLRYYGKNAIGRSSEIGQAQFIIDTIPPKIRSEVTDGSASDIVELSIKERGVIRYTLDGKVPSAVSAQYAKPITVPHQGRAVIKAYAWDEAGNQSELFEWERKYDFNAPMVVLTPPGGTFTGPPTVRISADKPCRIYYTLDGSPPDENSLLYSPQAGITISREGATTIRYFGIDEAGNGSEERSVKFVLDTKPPSVKVRIEGSLLLNNFLVRLTADEPAKIFYETGGNRPTPQSPVYGNPIPLQTGQSLSYMARDSAGNMSKVYVMDELKKPMVSANPEGGMYNRKVHVKFLTNLAGVVHWRMLPDTVFKTFRDSIPITSEGTHSLEYFLESQDGLKSPMRRSEYYTDWTPPRVYINVKKGMLDSVSVFFECTENATIYYTTDGSNPLYSNRTYTACNKFTMSKDRISLLRTADVKLAFYAEDAAGNQSALTILDVFKPRVIPNVPSGADRLYDRILSVALNSYDQSTIYYCRHGRAPTTDSSVFKTPITLISSDTIVAFAVDVSGFRGDRDTFVYHIDLPPSAHFSINPDTGLMGEQILFNAATSVDKETPLSGLLFRWDFDGDGVYDTKPSSDPGAGHTYQKAGRFRPRLEVTDVNKRVSGLSRTLLVRERCPSGMVSVVDDSARSFCMDRYEWPNSGGKTPRSGVSWVEAKVACLDAGKRLCTANEWESVCRNGSRHVYPYGDAYDKKTCPTEGKGVWKSGSFDECASAGVSDMIGNVWEWVEDRQGDYPTMMGGSFRDGKDAHCGLKVPSTIAAKADDVGFRCCR